MENECTEAYQEITDDEIAEKLKEIVNDMETDDILSITGLVDHIDTIKEEYEEENAHYLDYDQVVEMFCSTWEDCQGTTIHYTIDRIKAKVNDDIMLREDFNNYTDQLCKEGQVSDYAYNNWDNPF